MSAALCLPAERYCCRGLAWIAWGVLVLTGAAANGQTLTGHWMFDGNLQDNVGGNHGVTAGAGTVTLGPASGIAGGSVEFSNTGGSARRVEIPAAVIPATVGPNSPFSISWWDFTPAGSNTGANDGYLVASGAGSGFENFFFRRRLSGNQYNGGVRQDVTLGFSDLGVFSKGEWHHHTVTFDSGGTSLWYIDGALRGTDSGNSLNGLGAPLALGNRTAGDRPFTGRIDELQIYDAPLDYKQAALLRDNPGATLNDLSKFTIANASFEAPALVGSQGLGTNSDGALLNIPIAGWGESSATFAGADGPNSHPQNLTVAPFGPAATDGDQVAFLALRNSGVNDTWLFQSLGVVELEDVGTLLSAQVDVAARDDGNPDGAEALLAFATGVGVGSLGVNVGDQLSSASDDEVLIAEGFHTLLETLTIDNGLIGQELFLRLSVNDPNPASGSDQYYFDNVRLSVQAVVPEPSSWLLFAVCFIGAALGWRICRQK